jgi:hypothetical protein
MGHRHPEKTETVGTSGISNQTTGSRKRQNERNTLPNSEAVSPEQKLQNSGVPSSDVPGFAKSTSSSEAKKVTPRADQATLDGFMSKGNPKSNSSSTSPTSTEKKNSTPGASAPKDQ